MAKNQIVNFVLENNLKNDKMTEKYILKVRDKKKLMLLPTWQIYNLYISTKYRDLKKRYIFDFYELRDFIKKNNFETKSERKKAILDVDKNRKNFTRLCSKYDTLKLAKLLKVSRRTIFKWKKKRQVKNSIRSPSKNTDITKIKKYIYQSLLYKSIDDVAYQYKCSPLRISNLIKELKKQKVPELDYQEFKNYIKNQNDIEEIKKKFTISESEILLILLKLKIKLKK